MKKIAIILLFLFYGTGTIGATIHLHYCMNQFAGWSLWHSKKDKCSKCGMKEKKSGCCKDEHRHFKIKSDQRNSDIKYAVDFVAAPLTPVLPENFLFTSPQWDEAVNKSSNLPPPDYGIRRHILISIFRI